MNKFKSILVSLATVSAGTWARLALLLLSLVNAGLQLFGIGWQIPYVEQEVTSAVSLAFAALCALVGYWKNNSFTLAAQEADRVLRGEGVVVDFAAVLEQGQQEDPAA